MKKGGFVFPKAGDRGGHLGFISTKVGDRGGHLGFILPKAGDRGAILFLSYLKWEIEGTTLIYLFSIQPKQDHL